MVLDVGTIFLTTALVSLLIGGIQLLAYVRLQEKALAYWALTSLSFGLGCALFAIRELLPLPVSVLVGNGLVFLGLGFLSAGIRVFDGLRARTDTVLGVAALGVTALALTLPFGNLLGLRVTIVSLVVAFWALAASVALLRTPRGSPILSRLVSAYLLMGLAALHFSRAIAVQVGLLSPAASVNGPTQALALLIALSLGVAWSLGSLFMVLDRMASHDDLTGLANRRTTLMRARTLMEEAAAKRRPLSVLMADLDHFKSINDRFGHQLGDAVLRAFAQVAHQALRAGDLMGRYGGEEFCVVLPGADARAACVVAERLRAAAQDCLAQVDGQDTGATITIGTASFDGRDGSHADILWLINAADGALYDGKTRGRNRVESAPLPPPLAVEEPRSSVFAGPPPAIQARGAR